MGWAPPALHGEIDSWAARGRPHNQAPGSSCASRCRHRAGPRRSAGPAGSKTTPASRLALAGMTSASRLVLAGADVFGERVQRGGLSRVIGGQHRLGLLNQLVRNLHRGGCTRIEGFQGLRRAAGQAVPEAVPAWAAGEAASQTQALFTRSLRLSEAPYENLSGFTPAPKNAPRGSAPGRPGRGRWSWRTPGPCPPSCPAPRWWR